MGQRIRVALSQPRPTHPLLHRAPTPGQFRCAFLRHPSPCNVGSPRKLYPDQSPVYNFLPVRRHCTMRSVDAGAPQSAAPSSVPAAARTEVSTHSPHPRNERCCPATRPHHLTALKRCQVLDLLTSPQHSGTVLIIDFVCETLTI
jgi:hypothetical protein